MKRSEMIEKITDIISELSYRELAEKRAKRIMDMLEEKGMLPPIIWYYFDDVPTEETKN